MKRLGAFIVVIILWLISYGVSYSSTAMPVTKAVKEKYDNVGADSKTYSILQKQHTALSYLPGLKPEIKRKATQLEVTALNGVYSNELIIIRSHTDNPDYGLKICFYVALHTYLHRYQLF